MLAATLYTRLTCLTSAFTIPHNVSTESPVLSKLKSQHSFLTWFACVSVPQWWLTSSEHREAQNEALELASAEVKLGGEQSELISSGGGAAALSVNLL